jgi:hypothetical protein
MSMHEEVRLPTLVYLANVLSQERNVVWADRALGQWHFGFIRGLAPLPIIAADTRAHEVLPGIFPPA